MNGGDQLMIKDNIITAISSFLSSENLELYDLNIAGNETISKIEIFIFSDEELRKETQNLQKIDANFHLPIQDPDETFQTDGRNYRCLRCLKTKNYP